MRVSRKRRLLISRYIWCPARRVSTRSGALSALRSLAAVGGAAIASVNVVNLCQVPRGCRSSCDALAQDAGGSCGQLANRGVMLAVLGGLLGVGLAWMLIPILASRMLFNYIALTDARPMPACWPGPCADRDRRLPALQLDAMSLQLGVGPGPRQAGWLSGRAAGDVTAARQCVRSAPAHASSTSLALIWWPGACSSCLMFRDEAPQASFGGVDRRGTEGAAGRAISPPRGRGSTPWSRCRGGERVVARPVRHEDLWVPVIFASGFGRTDRPNARVDFVSARYFETMGMQIERL